MKLDKILLHIIRYGVYFSLFIPLFVTKYLYYPYNSTKVFVFRIIIEIIFVVWLILVFRKRIKLPKFNYLIWAILIFTGVSLISMFFGVEWYRSWWGTIERGSGLFIFLHYLAFFFILISVFREKKDWLRLINLFLIASLFASLYAFAQTLNLPIVHEAGLDRASGSIGNAAFLASYLIFGLFLSLGMVLKKDLQSFWLRSFYVFIFFITLAGIILTKTRGAVIGLTAGIFIFILLISIFHKNKKLKIVSAGLILILFFSITLIFINKDSNFVRNNSYLYRLTYINFEETTIIQRLHSWRAGLKAFVEKPVFGWGPENYNAAYNKYFDASYYDISRSSTYFDKAHNILIELLVTSGIFGLASYLFLLFLILYYLYKIYKKKNEDLMIIFSLTGLISAYFIQNLLVFDTILSYLSLFFILGYIYMLEKGRKEEEIIKSVNLSNFKIISLLLVFIGLGYLVIWQNTRPATSAFYTRQAMNEANKERYYYSNFSNYVRKSLSYQTAWDAEYIIFYTTIFKEFRGEDEIDKEAVGADLKYITEAGERYLAYNNNDVKYTSQLAILYEMLYDMLRDEKDLARAEELIKMAISKSPERVYFYHVLAQIYEFTGRDNEALAELEKARELNKNVPETYWSLALIYSKLEENDKIIENVKKALARNFSFSRVEDILNVLPIFEAEKDYLSLINLYGQAARIEPGNIDHLAHLAAAYAATGQNEEAIKTAQKIININPTSIDQINQFIIDVQEGKYLK